MSGCELEPSESADSDVLALHYRAGWLLSTLSYWSLYPQLATVCYQLLPTLG